MLTKKKLMYVTYYAPGVITAVRVFVTLWFLVSNPLGMPLRFLQLIPVGVLLAFCFTYFKLYSDGVPVISLIAPTLVHFVLVYVFERVIVVLPFAVLLLLDILYLIVKSVKANMFPFDFDNDDDPEGLDDVEEFLSHAE